MRVPWRVAGGCSFGSDAGFKYVSKKKAEERKRTYKKLSDNPGGHIPSDAQKSQRRRSSHCTIRHCPHGPQPPPSQSFHHLWCPPCVFAGARTLLAASEVRVSRVDVGVVRWLGGKRGSQQGYVQVPTCWAVKGPFPSAKIYSSMVRVALRNARRVACWDADEDRLCLLLWVLDGRSDPA